MTIAACHVSPEGVVLGADSTVTISYPDGRRCHFDHAQKLFEVGPPGSTTGLVTWGLGQVNTTSHRYIANSIARKHAQKPFDTLKKMAECLGESVWCELKTAYASQMDRGKQLAEKESTSTIDPTEAKELDCLRNDLYGGYCLAGRVESEPCQAFTIEWRVDQNSPVIKAVPSETPVFWGVPVFAERLVYGFDSEVIGAILESGQWSGSRDDLIELVVTNGEMMRPKHLPIREAIDWIYTVIQTTIRAVKFAHMEHYCGGPVEIASITCDRPFRWIRHKPLDSAIGASWA